MKKDLREYKKNGLQFSYVLDSIYSDKKELKSDEERIMYFFNTFNAEFNFSNNKKRFPNVQQRIAEYLKGLPSCISIAFTCYDIEQELKNFGYNLKGYKLSNAINNWFSVLAYRIIQIAKYYNIEVK